MQIQFNHVMVRVLAMLGALVLSACEKPAEPPAPPKPALVMTVNNSSASQSMVIVGEIRPRYESAQGFRIAGKIIERRVEIGQMVRRGQLIARLDATDTQLNAQASQADVRAAEADYALANAELARQRQLFAQKFISASALESREATVKTAAARLQQAQSKASVTGNQSGYTTLTAERDGVVTDIHAEPGQVISAGEVIVKVADLKQLEVHVAISESAVKALKVGDEAQIRLWADKEKIYRGKVREIAPTADSMTRTFLVKVTMDEIDSSVKLGMTTGVKFTQLSQNAILLPSASVTERDGKTVIWVVDAKTHQVHVRPVSMAGFHEDGVLVQEGVGNGDQVVVAGVHMLIDGQVVSPVEAGAAK